MHTVTIKVDDSIYAKFLGFLELLPKDKAVVIEDEPYYEPNEETKQAIEDLEADRNCERFKSAKEMFEACGI